MPLVLATIVVLHLPDALEAGLGRHELEDVVHGESNTNLSLTGRCLETRPHLEANSRKVGDVLDVEEAWRSPQLLQIGLSEGLLEDHIDEILTDIVVLVLKVVSQVNVAPRFRVDLDCTLDTSEASLEDQGFLKLL